MSRYITTKADFTLRRKHKKGSGATIYENDYTTINPMPNALKGEYVIGDSNFVFTSRLGINGQKKHVRGKFVPNPMGENSAWTIDTIIDSGITNETKIRLKPDYTSIRDFACYGSAVKLVQGTVNGVITDFPAEMYLSDEKIVLYNTDDVYSFDSESGTKEEYNLLYNEYGIDITTKDVKSETVYNPLRYFTLCGSSYVYFEEESEPYTFKGFTVTPKSVGECYNGKDVWVDKFAIVDIAFTNGQEDKVVTVTIFKDYKNNDTYYTYTGGASGAHIRPEKQIVENYFRDCDDFTAVLLNRDNRPLYSAVFETPSETETGFIYDMERYTWPSLLGGYNPDLSGPYFTYVKSLLGLGEFYDEYFTDNMWRSLTHEAIKTLDWTYVSNTGDEIEDMSKIDTSRIEPITKIYGRQFDDLKRYADGIKSINTITYNQRSNTPDYTLTDVLENSGWETKTLKITTDNDLRTDVLYDGLTSGYTASDANNEFLRRMKLNSSYLQSIKGTRKGLDTMLALLGIEPENYDIHEYVYVFSGNTFPRFCESTKKLEPFSYPLAKDVATINKYKVNFNAFDPYGDYCGIPVAEIGFESAGTDYSYVVPWFSYGKNYDDGLYFQKHGGWGRRHSMEIDLEIASAISAISEWDPVVPLYMETQARLKFAKDFDELLQEAFSSSNTNDVFYVTDVSKIQDVYSPKEGESIATDVVSHYFVLEHAELNQYLGFSSNLGKYGWRSITNQEITTLGPDGKVSTAGTLVLYLESIKDDTNGNNPHVGNGTYDDGAAYLSGMSEIFAYSILNKNFIGVSDADCDKIKQFKFDIEKQEDNRKCWFFSDNYNFKYGKNVKYKEPEEGEEVDGCGEVISASSDWSRFLEVEVTNDICNIKNCSDFKFDNVQDQTVKEKYSGCTDSLYYDITDLLVDENSEVIIGKDARPHVFSGDVYERYSNLNTFDPEAQLAGTEEYGTNGEAAANSVVNVKNLYIHFDYPEGLEEEDETAYKRYIENSVIPYLTQMIPSTSILFWSFGGDSGDTRECEGEDCDRGDEKPLPPPTPTEEIVETEVSGKFVQTDSSVQEIEVEVSGRFTQEDIEIINTRISGTFTQIKP